MNAATTADGWPPGSRGQVRVRCNYSHRRQIVTAFDATLIEFHFVLVGS
jgi:hypothetical protein